MFWNSFFRNRSKKVKYKARNFREVTFQTGVDVLGQPSYTTHLISLTENIGFQRKTYTRSLNHR